mmetsp:Transcript_18002/g.54186  ORF Transcript_18002/g.54186 Transcript_18002/m.54186 type:complete len:123 (+) Transcript_18002:78-446(+)
MWLADVAYGALTPGINVPTVAVLNVALLGCIGCLLFLLIGAVSSSSWLIPHAAFLLLLAVGLLISINWFVYQLGTVSPAEQQRQLFSSTEGAAACAGTATDAKPAPATELAGAAQSDPHKQQ